MAGLVRVDSGRSDLVPGIFAKLKVEVIKQRNQNLITQESHIRLSLSRGNGVFFALIGHCERRPDRPFHADGGRDGRLAKTPASSTVALMPSCS